MLQQCNHPNVVRYLGSYQGEDYLWVSIWALAWLSLLDIGALTVWNQFFFFVYIL